MALSLSREKEILAKLDKLRQEIHKLYSTPSKNAWGDMQSIEAKQKEMTSLEKELRQDETSLTELVGEVDEFLGMSQPHREPSPPPKGFTADQWKEALKRANRRNMFKKVRKVFSPVEEGK
jgi:hypothetical protein